MPVVPVSDDLYVAELFHGPTFAFKGKVYSLIYFNSSLDLALQFVGNMCDYFLEKRKLKTTILVATSGDTGSAALQAVKGKNSIECFVLYPKGRISEFQENQMTTIQGNNIHVLCVEDSTSDDLDDILKLLFDDVDFNKQHNLCSINSINWARIMIQMVHYFWSYFRVRDSLIKNKNIENVVDFWPEFNFSVPTGAFGNSFAGILTKKMGLPISRIVVATNENDILNRFLTNGIFSRGSVVKTLSPSIDIQVPYNFERLLYYLSEEQSPQVREWMLQFKETGSLDLSNLLSKAKEYLLSESINDKETTLIIKQYFTENNYLLDPHSAVGVAAALKLKNVLNNLPLICLATAHACKFADAMKEAVGFEPVPPHTIEDMSNLKKYHKEITKKDAEETLRKMVHEYYLKKE